MLQKFHSWLSVGSRPTLTSYSRVVHPISSKLTRIYLRFVAVVSLIVDSHLLPHFQLLHVLRDGRDIAFSVNQGPVEKFYANMYGTSDFSTPVPLKAMRLWSDWNSQIYNWSIARTLK